MALNNFSSWHFKCIISGVSSQGKAFHSVLFFQKHLGYGGLTVFLHFKGFVVSVSLHLGKDEPFPKHWLIRQRESHIDNAWKRKQNTVNSVTVQPWTQLSRSRGKTQYTEEKINNLELTTTKWLQVIPFYHPRAPRILQGGLGMRNIAVKLSITNRFNSVCNKELPFVTYTLHWQLKCNKYLSKMSWRYFTWGICFLELFKSSAPFPCL